MPTATVTLVVLPFTCTLTVDLPFAVVTAAVGTYSAFAAELLVVMETLAV